MLIHNVFFWLKESTPENVVQFLSELKKLEKVEEIVSIDIGVPAPIMRDVVDHTYSAALVVSFLDKSNHDIYQTHPLHKEFLARNKEKWSKVQIYDINT